MTRRALFVGIDDYQYLNPLNCAVADATAMCGFFRDRANFDTDTLLNDQADDPGDIYRKIAATRDGLGKGDLLLVFLAGHGVDVNHDKCFVCRKTTEDDPYSEKRGCVRLIDLLDKSRGPQDTIIIVDACRTDIMRETQEAAREYRRLVVKGVVPRSIFSFFSSGKKAEVPVRRDLSFADSEAQKSPPPQNTDDIGEIVMIFSCKEGTTAAEFDGHGLFTRALLDELDEAAAKGLRVFVDYPFTQGLNTRMKTLFSTMFSGEKAQRAEFRHEGDADGIELLPGVCIETGPDDGPGNRDKAPREGERHVVGLHGGLSLPMQWCMATTKGGWMDGHNGREWFQMGSPADEPCRDWLAQDDRDMAENRHPVCLSSGFWIGETAVTQKQWRAIMGKGVEDLCARAIADGTPYEWPGSDPSRPQTFRDRKRRQLEGGAGPAALCYNEMDDAPVYFTNWNDAMEFCRRLTDAERNAGRLPEGYAYRLPTEAEWEFACRAGTETTLPNGATFIPDDRGDASALDDIAWYAGNSFAGWEGKGEDPAKYGRPQQNPALRMAQRSVYRKAANGWQIKGMLGNVWEWCLDFAGQYPLVRQDDPCGPHNGSYHIVRGGCWYSDAFECRPAARWRHEPGFRNWSVGFRIVLAREVRP